MLPNRQPLDVLKDEIRGSEFGHNAYELSNKAIARIVEYPMTDQRESLAGGTAKYDIHSPGPYPSSLPYLGSGQSGNRLREHDASRKVVFVYSAMNGVYFNCGDDVEAGLLETQPKAPSTSK